MARRHEEWVIALIGELSHRRAMRLNRYEFDRDVSLCRKNANISSRAAIVGWPASSIRLAVTTLCGVVTWRSKNGARSVFAALSGSTRPMKRSPSASV
jgi:hypothetical protein